MFKKLFGKKEKKAESFEVALNDLLETISEETLNSRINESLKSCIDFLPKPKDENVDLLYTKVFEIATNPETRVVQASLAFTVCGFMVEKGYPCNFISDSVIELYAELLKKAQIFFNHLVDKVKESEAGELEEEADFDIIYRDLLENRELISFEVAKATVSVEEFYAGIVSIVSSQPQILEKAKAELKELVDEIAEHSTGVNVVSQLLKVLTDEPIVVIDTDNNTGFEGTITGISDNYQLQHLLMSLPELNSKCPFDTDTLKVLKGETPMQQTPIVEVSKWEMFNLEVIKQEEWQEKINVYEGVVALSEFWIWSEGTPADIAVHNGKRVVLLSKAKIKRSTRIQRTFKNLKANIKIEKMLSEEEINTWLSL